MRPGCSSRALRVFRTVAGMLVAWRRQVYALDWHAISWSELHLRRNLSNGQRNQGDGHISDGPESSPRG